MRMLSLQHTSSAVIFRDGTYMTLREVFESLDLTGYDLNVDLLDAHAGRSTFHRFDKFSLKYNPCDQSRLSRIFFSVVVHRSGNKWILNTHSGKCFIYAPRQKLCKFPLYYGAYVLIAAALFVAAEFAKDRVVVGILDGPIRLSSKEGASSVRSWIVSDDDDDELITLQQSDSTLEYTKVCLRLRLRWLSMVEK
ncbi:AMP deaminase, partial [Tanacetum coccineum]